MANRLPLPTDSPGLDAGISTPTFYDAVAPLATHLDGIEDDRPETPTGFFFALAARLLALSPAMAQDTFDINYVAELARLELTDDEKSRLGAQLNDILKYVDQLREVDVSGVEPTAHSVPLVNVTRPDVVRDSLSRPEALRNAPRQANGLFLVPKIVE